MPRKKIVPKPQEIFTTTRTINAEIRAREVVERGLIAPVRLTVTVKPGAIERFGQDDIESFLRSFEPYDVSYNRLTDKLSLGPGWNERFDFLCEEGELRQDDGEVHTIEREYATSLRPASNLSDSFYRR